MWDLSVPGGGDHDFYIDVVRTAVLVHNCPDVERYNPSKFKTCLIKIFAALSILHGGVSHMSDLSNEDADYTTIQQRYQDTSTSAPQTPGGDSDGGGPDEDDGC
jgi:hypothetical protein